MNRKALGTHLLIEMYGCEPRTLMGVEFVGQVMERAARESKAKVVESFFHQFQPYGVSGVVVIEESHYTIHTWPEHGYAAVDLFYCSEEVEVEKAIQVLKESFRPSYISIIEMKRGVLPEASTSKVIYDAEQELVS